MRTTNAILLATILLLTVLERIPAIRRLRLRVIRPFFASDVGLLAFGFVCSAVVTGYIATGSDSFGRLGMPRLSSSTIPLWGTSLLALILLDLGNYVTHFILHRFDALWEFHKVHHSSPVLDWLATFRFHMIELVLRRLVAVLLLIVAGVPLDAVAIAAAALQAWGIVNHSNISIDLRFLEPLMITPRLHHLHHVPSTSGRNFGTVFSVWDRLMGRLETTDVAPDVELGLPGETSTYPQGFLKQLTEPFRRLSQRRLSMGRLDDVRFRIDRCAGAGDSRISAPAHDFRCTLRQWHCHPRRRSRDRAGMNRQPSAALVTDRQPPSTQGPRTPPR